MIEYLHIKDMAIIDELEVEFGEGFNVITGETGAGKSILVQAVSLLRGGRPTAEMVRSGASQALVEAVLRPPDTPGVKTLLAELEYDLKPEIPLTRVIMPGGKGRVRILGELSSVSVLNKLVGALLELSGQHDQQSLSSTANHRKILDAFGVDSKLVDAVSATYDRLREVLAEYDALPTDAEKRAARQDYLTHQLSEIEAARITPGEEEALEADRRRLASASDLEEAARWAEEVLYGEGSVTERLSQVARRLSGLAHVEAAFAETAQRMGEARAVCEDLAMDLRRYADGIESDPRKLAQVEERILMLSTLRRKHGCAAIEELLERRTAMAEELEDLARFDDLMVELDSKLAEAVKEAQEAASALSRARSEAARKLEQAVMEGLAQLGMKSTRFEVRVDGSEARSGDDPRLCVSGRRLGPNGWDRVEMMVAANPGEPLRPVSRIASGGELSRILLAFKAAMARTDTVGAYVFDEVDSGIGGAVADVVGRKLKEVASFRQVLCVTHLPQIAAYAEKHFLVTKKTVSGRTVSQIRALSEEERVEELARMLGGKKVTEKARAHAREMVRLAQ